FSRRTLRELRRRFLLALVSVRSSRRLSIRRLANRSDAAPFRNAKSHEHVRGLRILYPTQLRIHPRLGRGLALRLDSRRYGKRGIRNRRIARIPQSLAPLAQPHVSSVRVFPPPPPIQLRRTFRRPNRSHRLAASPVLHWPARRAHLLKDCHETLLTISRRTGV